MMRVSAPRRVVTRVGLAAASALLLAACADPPGAAAVVDGRVIDQSSADDASQVLCLFALAGGSGQAVDNADVRRQAVTQLVLHQVADRLARRDGIRVPASAERLTTTERQRLAAVSPDLVTPSALRLVEADKRFSAIVLALGERSTGQTVPEDEPADRPVTAQVTRAGQAAIAEELGRSEVRFAPRYGLDGDATPVGTSGSLSVAASGSERRGPVPATQQCRA